MKTNSPIHILSIFNNSFYFSVSPSEWTRNKNRWMDLFVCSLLCFFFNVLNKKRLGGFESIFGRKSKSGIFDIQIFYYDSRYDIHISKKYRRIVSGQTLTCCHNHLIKLQCDTAIYRALLAHFIFSRKCLYRNVVQATKSNQTCILNSHQSQTNDN